MCSPDWFNILTSGLVACLGALVGALTAFRLEVLRQNKSQRRQQVASANRAIFTLGQMLITLLEIKHQCIDPSKQDTLRHVTIRPTIELNSPLKFDVAQLTFLLETSQPDLLNQLLLQERRFLGFIDGWNHRSALHLNELQPKLERAGFEDGDFEQQDIKNALGQALTANMIMLTDELVQQNDDAIRSINEFSEKLGKELNKLFPKEHFSEFQTVKEEDL